MYRDCVYVFGGENKPSTPIDSDMYMIDLSKTDAAWVKVAVNGTPPAARVAHSQTLCKETANIYVFGGYQHNSDMKHGEEPLNDLHCFNIASSTWSKVEAASPPTKRSFQKMCSIGSNLYVFGGCEVVDRKSDLHCFDTNTSLWSMLAQSPDISGRGGASFAAAPSANALVVIAGYSGKENGDVHMYDIASDAWIQLGAKALSNKLRPRSVAGTCTLNKNGEKVVIFGGEVDPSSKGHDGAGGFANDIVLFDTRTGVLSNSLNLAPTSDPSPQQRGWTHTEPLSDGRSFVVFGGLSGDDSAPQRLQDLHVMKLV